MTIAIIGAGIAGAAAALHLGRAGRDTVLFDKGRGVGGRLATRRIAAAAEGALAFDHGAPFVTASGGTFSRFLHASVQNGHAALWGDAGVEARTVGMPGMNGLVKAALLGSEVRTSFEAASLSRTATGWTLTAKDGATAEGFSDVLVAIPAPQAAALLGPVHPDFAAAAEDSRYMPCWTLMLAADGVDSALAGTPETALAGEGIATLIHNSAKPGRSAGTLVAHASPAWSTARLEDDREAVAGDLAAIVTGALGLPAPAVAVAHRWRYARLARVSARGPDYDADAGIGIAGDWCLGPDVEDAFHSGIALAEAVLTAGRPHVAAPATAR